MAEPLIINNFEAGIGDSPHKGFGLMRNVDIETFPGAAMVNGAATTLFRTAISGTFVGVIATDICTATGFTVPSESTAAVKVTTTANGFTANTVYFIGRINNSTFYMYDTLKNALDGTATGRIDVTGTGTMTVASVNPGTIKHIIDDDRSGELFFLDSNGRVWFGNSSLDGGRLKLLVNTVLDNAVSGSTALASASGNGMVLWQKVDSASTHWLLVFRNDRIDIVDVYGNTAKQTPNWTNSWDYKGTASDASVTLNTAAGTENRHHAIAGQDDIVYYTDAQYIGSIKVASGQTFAPGTASTFTGTKQALDTPVGEILVHLEELGTKLLAAGSKSNNIYPWDRIADSFDLPLKVPEYNVQRLKNIGNLVYILAGTKGNIYTTQGTYVRSIKKLPEYVTNASATVPNSITWGGIGTINNGLLFGASVLTSGNSGIYLLYPDGRLVIDQIPSTGTTNATAIYAEGQNSYFFGYASGADYISSTRYSALNGVIQSMWYRVATKTEKGTYSKLEVVTAKPATTGAQIRIRYRLNTSTAFDSTNTLATYTADSSTVVYQTDDIGLIDIENIQVQAEFDDDVELIEIRLIP